MKLSPTAAIAIAGLCFVTACGPKAGGNAAAGGTTTAAGGAQASGPDQVISFADLPRPKAGLWQQTMDDGDGHPASTTSCLSGKNPNVKMPKSCTQFTITRTFLGAIKMHMNCSSPEFSMVSDAVATGDMQSSMTSDMTMTVTMQGQPPKTSKMHIDAKYMGPCAPGQTPDDADDDNATAPG
ncbi:MAG TPA: DUF3617 family protein [Caulobacteraceae bacterium]|jgi:hypothetical protein